ncbi:MAG: hypothetical protein MJZ81_07270 [Bacteroidales bacterium]|nr:hypothetical protein [Bacteroidales bacterium]
MKNVPPVEIPCGVFSSWKYGFGRILTAQNCGIDDIPNREDFLKTLRGIACSLSEFDVDIVNGKLVTFDPEFSKAIGGYPKDACLWYKRDDGAMILLRSAISDNTYDFNKDSSFVGEYWIATSSRDVSAGFPIEKGNDVVSPFGVIKSRNIKRKGQSTSRITGTYVARSDSTLVCNATIDWIYDNRTRLPGCARKDGDEHKVACLGKYNNVGHHLPWYDASHISSATPYYNYLNFGGRFIGTIPCIGHQLYVAVSDIGEDTIPLKAAYIGSPHDSLDGDYLENQGNPGSTFRDTYGFPYNAIFNGTYTPTTPNVEFSPDKKNEGSDGVRPGGGEVSYYPVFNTDMSPRTLTLPIRAGQTIYIVESARNGFSVSDFSVDIKLYPVRK